MSVTRLHLVVGAEAQRMHFPGLHRTDEKRAATLIVTPEGHLPGVVDTRPGLDAETRWQLDALQRQLIRRQAHREHGQSKPKANIRQNSHIFLRCRLDGVFLKRYIARVQPAGHVVAHISASPGVEQLCSRRNSVAAQACSIFAPVPGLAATVVLLIGEALLQARDRSMNRSLARARGMPAGRRAKRGNHKRSLGLSSGSVVFAVRKSWVSR
jgi:hypothetical protein